MSMVPDLVPDDTERDRASEPDSAEAPQSMPPGSFFTPSELIAEARALSEEAIRAVSSAFAWVEESRRHAEKW
jgi:hypothetical protein